MSIKPIRLFDAPSPSVDTESILGALECSIVAVDADGSVSFVNDSAQRFFAASASQLCGNPIDNLVPRDSPIIALIRQAQRRGVGVSEYGLVLDTPRTRTQLVNVQVSPLNDRPGSVVVAIFERNIADKIAALLPPVARP